MRKRVKSILSFLVISTVYTSCISQAYAFQNNNNMETKLLIGEDRFKTSFKVIDEGWNNCDSVILVNSTSIPDALIASSLSKMKNAPIMLTEKDRLRKDTKRKIKELNCKKVYIVGGEGVISNKVEQQLKNINLNIERFSGKDRYLTSLAVAEEFVNNGEINSIAVVNGKENLNHGISIGALAARDNMPVILNHKDNENNFQMWLDNYSINNAYIVGGENTVSKNIENKLENNIKFYGNTAEKTNSEVIKEFYKDEKFNSIYVSKSWEEDQHQHRLIDGILASTLAYKQNTFVLLPKEKLSKDQIEILKNKSVNNLVQVGGGLEKNILDEIIEIFKDSIEDNDNEGNEENNGNQEDNDNSNNEENNESEEDKDNQDNEENNGTEEDNNNGDNEENNESEEDNNNGDNEDNNGTEEDNNNEDNEENNGTEEDNDNGDNEENNGTEEDNNNGDNEENNGSQEDNNNENIENNNFHEIKNNIKVALKEKKCDLLKELLLKSPFEDVDLKNMYFYLYDLEEKDLDSITSINDKIKEINKVSGSSSKLLKRIENVDTADYLYAILNKLKIIHDDLGNEKEPFLIDEKYKEYYFKGIGKNKYYYVNELKIDLEILYRIMANQKNIEKLIGEINDLVKDVNLSEVGIDIHKLNSKNFLATEYINFFENRNKVNLKPVNVNMVKFVSELKEFKEEIKTKLQKI